jgi:hypothetical protein
MPTELRVWFDGEGDFLEIQFSEDAGYMKATSHESVMARVNHSGDILGFTIQGVSRLAAPLDFILRSA